MTDSIVGTEYLPNVHIEKIFLQSTNVAHKIMVKISVYDYEEKTWSLDDKFTSYFSILNKFSDKVDEANLIRSGQLTIKNVIDTINSSHSKIIPFSSFTETTETIRGTVYTKFTVDLSEEIENVNNVFYFCCSQIDIQELKQNERLNLSYVQNPSYLGSYKSETIIEGGIPARNLSFVFRNENNIPWTGPVHEMETVQSSVVSSFNEMPKRYMVGSQHSPARDERVFLSSLESISKVEEQVPIITSAISGNPNSPNIPSRPAAPGAPPSYRTIHQEEYVEDISRNVSNTIVADLASIILQESETATIMNNIFPEKFTEIVENSNLKNIEVDRTSVAIRRPTSGVRRILSRPNFSNSKLVAKSHNNNRKVKKKTLYKLSSTEIISVDPNTVTSDSKTFLYNGRNLTTNMLKNAFKIGRIEQVDLSLPKSLRPISFTDYSINSAKAGTYFYRIKLTMEDEHLLYCRQFLKDLLKMQNKIQNLHNVLIMKNVYNGEQFDIKFLKDFYSQYNITVNTETGFVEGEFNTELLKNSYLVKSFEILAEAENLIGTRPLAKFMTNNLNLFSTSLDKIQNTANRFKTIIERFKSVYNLSDGQSFEKVSTKSKKRQSIIEKSIVLKNSYKRKLLEPIGINFINMNPSDDGLPMVNLLNFDKRASKEVSKFFTGPLSANSNSFPLVSNDIKNEVSKIEETKYMNFTPAKIFFGGKELDTTEINTESFDADFFNSIRIATAALDSENNVDPSNNIDENEITKYLDSREFLGDTTKFNNIIFIALVKNPSAVLKIRRKFKYLDNSILKSKKRNISLKTFDLNQPNNILSMKIKKDPKKVPLQMKALSLLKTPLTNFNLDTIDFDPISNPQTQEVFMQNYLNISKVEALMGFEKINGRFRMDKPIYKEMNSETHEKLKNMNVVCRLRPQSLDGLGVDHEKYNIHDKVFILKSKNDLTVGDKDV